MPQDDIIVRSIERLTERVDELQEKIGEVVSLKDEVRDLVHLAKGNGRGAGLITKLALLDQRLDAALERVEKVEAFAERIEDMNLQEKVEVKKGWFSVFVAGLAAVPGIIALLI